MDCIRPSTGPFYSPKKAMWTQASHKRAGFIRRRAVSSFLSGRAHCLGTFSSLCTDVCVCEGATACLCVDVRARCVYAASSRVDDDRLPPSPSAKSTGFLLRKSHKRATEQPGIRAVCLAAGTSPVQLSSGSPRHDEPATAGRVQASSGVPGLRAQLGRIQRSLCIHQ